MMLMDDVVCPAHYRFESFDAIDVVEAVARTIPRGDDAANTGNILKYMMRWPRKDGLKDLYKARQYLDRLIRIVESRTGGAPAEASQHPMMAEAIRDEDERAATPCFYGTYVPNGH